MRIISLLLAVLGLILPYSFFVPFLIQNGLDFSLFFSQLFANNISTFFAVDLIVCAIAFLTFSYQDAKKYRIRNWWLYVIGTLAIGPSFKFPLFLYFREHYTETLDNPSPRPAASD